MNLPAEGIYGPGYPFRKETAVEKTHRRDYSFPPKARTCRSSSIWRIPLILSSCKSFSIPELQPLMIPASFKMRWMVQPLSCRLFAICSICDSDPRSIDAIKFRFMAVTRFAEEIVPDRPLHRVRVRVKAWPG